MALTERFGAPVPTTVRPPGTTTSGALARYGAALRDDPWRESVPVTLDRVEPVPDGDGWQLADADEDHALPVGAAARSRPGCGGWSPSPEAPRSACSASAAPAVSSSGGLAAGSGRGGPPVLTSHFRLSATSGPATPMHLSDIAGHSVRVSLRPRRDPRRKGSS